MSIFNKIFKRLNKKEILVDIYRDEITDSSLTGIVLDYNHSFCCLNLIADDGTNNGISIVKNEDITRVRWEGNVIKSISMLMKDKNTKKISHAIKLKSLKSIIKSIQSNFGYINIYTEYMNDDVCFIGELKGIDDNHILIYEFGTMASLDRHNLILSIEQISRIDAESQYEKDILFLHNTPS